jgi:hypothetical protein
LSSGISEISFSSSNLLDIIKAFAYDFDVRQLNFLE